MSNMEELDGEESILTIIDQLRMRKARPDLVRICHMASRRHGLNHLDTEALLDKLVESGVIVKVEYKGNISYRNAAKWKKRPFGKNIFNSPGTTKSLIDAIKAVCERDQDKSASDGVPVRNIEKWLQNEAQPQELLNTRTQLLSALQNEVENGSLSKLANGNYSISTDSDIAKPKTAIVKKKTTTSATAPRNREKETSPIPKRGRPPSKRKVYMFICWLNLMNRPVFCSKLNIVQSYLLRPFSRVLFLYLDN